LSILEDLSENSFPEHCEKLTQNEQRTVAGCRNIMDIMEDAEKVYLITTILKRTWIRGNVATFIVLSNNLLS
jgi:hypothetical protein